MFMLNFNKNLEDFVLNVEINYRQIKFKGKAEKD